MEAQQLFKDKSFSIFGGTNKIVWKEDYLGEFSVLSAYKAAKRLVENFLENRGEIVRIIQVLFERRCGN